MAPHEALRALGLTSEATADQIRQAYRDLVKVWHPDRFGTDARLRAKAEDQLKTINAAFRTLEQCGFRADAPAEPPPPPDTPQYEYPSARSHERAARGWLYVAALVLIAAMVGFTVHSVGSTQPRPTTSEPPTSALPEDKAPAAPTRKPQSSKLSAEPAEPRAFRVHSLSDADTERLQFACASHTPGTESYRDCVAAQLDALSQKPGTPNLTGMSTGERDAAENACRTARSGGDAAYSRCLRHQVAELSAEPIRPDLSTFSPADRDSVRTACSAASRRGAADYDRCLARFARTLSAVELAPAAP